MSCWKFDKLLLLQCSNRWPRSWHRNLWTQKIFFAKMTKKMKKILCVFLSQKRWEMLEKRSFYLKCFHIALEANSAKVTRWVSRRMCKGSKLVFGTDTKKGSLGWTCEKYEKWPSEKMNFFWVLSKAF